MKNFNQWFEAMMVLICIISISNTATAGTCCIYQDGNSSYTLSTNCPRNFPNTGSYLLDSLKNVTHCNASAA